LVANRIQKTMILAFSARRYHLRRIPRHDGTLFVAREPPAILFMANAEFASNQIAKTFLDFSVTWNGRLPPIFGIHVDVVPSTMPFQMATGSYQFAN